MTYVSKADRLIAAAAKGATYGWETKQKGTTALTSGAVVAPELTPDQRTRFNMDLPYEGAQPGLIAMQVEDRGSSRIKYPGENEFFVLDGRHPHNQVLLHQVCVAHAVDVVKTWPSREAVISVLPALGADGKANGGARHIRVNSLNTRQILEEFSSPEAVKLARTLRGENTIRYRDLSDAPALVDDLFKVTGSVCTRFRDADFTATSAAQMFGAVDAAFRPRPTQQHLRIKKIFEDFWSKNGLPDDLTFNQPYSQNKQPYPQNNMGFCPSSNKGGSGLVTTAMKTPNNKSPSKEQKLPDHLNKNYLGRP